MHWGLVCCSAQSYLNKVLITIGAMRVCYDKTVIQAMESVLAALSGKGHTPWSDFLETEMELMVQYMQGWAWRPLLAENQDEGPNWRTFLRWSILILSVSS